MSTLILPKPSTEPGLYYGKYVAGLFANNEQGIWYDPSDLSTLFQDAAGTTPVTAPGQPVGLVMDARKTEIFKITKTDLLDTTKWVGVGGPTASQNPDGSVRITRNTSTRFCGFSPRIGSYTLPPGCAVRIRVSLTASTTGFLFSGEPYYNWRDGNPGFLSWAIPAGMTINKNTVGINLTGSTIVPDEGLRSILFGFFMSGNADGQFSASDYIDVLDFEIVAYHPPARQTSTTSRPVLQQDSAGKYYLQFDGVDDWLQTGSINFTSTDKMTVFAGVRKQANGFQNIAELGDPTTNNGTSSLLLVSSSIFSGASYASAIRSGVANANEAFAGIGPYSAPIQSVVSVQLDRSKTTSVEEILYRHNAQNQSLIVLTDTNPSGNFGTFPLSLGRRGTTGAFNGRLYGLVVRGAQTGTTDLANVERYLAYKSGVVL